MELVSPNDIVKAFPILDHPGGEHLASLILKMMKLDRINRFYDQTKGLPAMAFIDEIISTLRIRYEIAPGEIQNIPQKGPFITVSNHPYGGLDGIILLKILPAVRPDFKVLMNFLLARVKPIENYSLRVNPFEKMPGMQSSYGGLKEAIAWLGEGHAMGLFPAGEVASFKLKTGTVTDKQWPHSILKLIRKARVPVVPVHFDGHNSLQFQLLGMLHPMMRTASLPSELFNKSGKTIGVRIGRPVSVREQDKLGDIAEFGRYLRMRTFSLGIPSEKHLKIWSFSHGNAQEVAEVGPRYAIEKEIEQLKNDSILFSLGDHMVFSARAEQIPAIMQELGRLREITYREVGEGTGKPFDIDEFDRYYDQLFIWNDRENMIIGGYRIGFGNRIMKESGIRGFYISTLFHISDKFAPVLELSMELGRSFIIRSYQKKPLSLFLLWKGILNLLCSHPELRYLIGPVSISNEFRDLSKTLTVAFLRKNFYNREYGALLKPRKRFIGKINPVIKKKVFHKVTGNSLSRLDNFIQAFDPGFQAPVLLKKYLSVNAEVIGFNVDPNFNNCLDVLIITDVLDIPAETIRSLSKEVTDNSVSDRFFQDNKSR